MKQKKRMLFGVITTEANRVEHRLILKGIIEQAKVYQADVAVLSNVYNTNETCEELFCENRIYDLIASSLYDGLILIAEPFINSELIAYIKQQLSKKDVPLVVIGVKNHVFDFPNVRFINTSDENDIMEITNHMIEVHGYQDISLLTGPESKPESHMRMQGYRRALESHGIAFDQSKVHFGTFWVDSGEELARRYISGDLPYPEALVCANDCMAYGVLDEFEANGINILEKFALAGYENLNERVIHYPMLTTYQRNKKALGKNAVQMIYEKVKKGIDMEFTPPRGDIIHGLSCRCGSSNLQVLEEIKFERIKRKYDTWTVYAPMEQRLTQCSTLEEFIKEVGEYQYLVRFVQDIWLCLFENWYELDKRTKTENMIGYNVMPWNDRSPFQMKKYGFNEIIERNENAAAYYFNPIFFNDISLGYIMLRYDNPDAYDDNFRNWLKAISNCLVFLCMKNDIRYLTQCQNLSETKDSLTDLNNDKGLEKAFRSLTAQNESQNLFFVMLKICMYNDDFADFDKKKKISSVLDAADAVREFCGNRSSICGRISDTVFGCFIQSDSVSCEQLTENLNAIFTQHKTYLKNYGMNSFVCCAVQTESDDTYSEICQKCIAELEILMNTISEMRMRSNYPTMLKIRNEIYLNPDVSNTIDEVCYRYSYSSGYLRNSYKNCFDVSFHRDSIESRLAKAKYLLCTTNLTVGDIAVQCGYKEMKYFLRQFKQLAGITPNQYRSIHST